MACSGTAILLNGNHRQKVTITCVGIAVLKKIPVKKLLGTSLLCNM
jgi:hypothetical protein